MNESNIYKVIFDNSECELVNINCLNSGSSNQIKTLLTKIQKRYSEIILITNSDDESIHSQVLIDILKRLLALKEIEESRRIFNSKMCDFILNFYNSFNSTDTGSCKCGIIDNHLMIAFFDELNDEIDFNNPIGSFIEILDPIAVASKCEEKFNFIKEILFSTIICKVFDLTDDNFEKKNVEFTLNCLECNKTVNTFTM